MTDSIELFISGTEHILIKPQSLRCMHCCSENISKTHKLQVENPYFLWVGSKRVDKAVWKLMNRPLISYMTTMPNVLFLGQFFEHKKYVLVVSLAYASRNEKVPASYYDRLRMGKISKPIVNWPNQVKPIPNLLVYQKNLLNFGLNKSVWYWFHKF